LTNRSVTGQETVRNCCEVAEGRTNSRFVTTEKAIRTFGTIATGTCLTYCKVSTWQTNMSLAAERRTVEAISRATISAVISDRALVQTDA